MPNGTPTIPLALCDLFIRLYSLFYSGLFYSHVGWLLCERHPESVVKTAEMNMADLENDPLLRFQKK